MGNFQYTSGDYNGNVNLDPGANLAPVAIEGSNVTVNGKGIQGRSISVVNGIVYIDGIPQARGDYSPYLSLVINIEGNVTGGIDTGSGDVNVTGSVHDIDMGSGDITIGGDVLGNVDVGSGDIQCRGSIHGSIDTGSGNVISHNEGGRGKTKKRRRE